MLIKKDEKPIHNMIQLYRPQSYTTTRGDHSDQSVDSAPSTPLTLNLYDPFVLKVFMIQSQLFVAPGTDLKVESLMSTQ